MKILFIFNNLMTAETPRLRSSSNLSTLKRQDLNPLKHQDLQVVETNNLFKQVVKNALLWKYVLRTQTEGLSAHILELRPKPGRDKGKTFLMRVRVGGAVAAND
jgi:hypothetical protein